MNILVLDKKKNFIVKIDPVVNIFLYFLKNASGITKIRFYVCAGKQERKMANKMFPSFSLDLIEIKSIEKYNNDVFRQFFFFKVIASGITHYD